jgi:hypothetical protein
MQIFQMSPGTAGITDLAKFRHLFIRQSVGFVNMATGPDLAEDIDLRTI